MMLATPAPVEVEPPRPITRRLWFWMAVTGAVVAGVLIGVAVHNPNHDVARLPAGLRVPAMTRRRDAGRRPASGPRPGRSGSPGCTNTRLAGAARSPRRPVRWARRWRASVCPPRAGRRALVDGTLGCGRLSRRLLRPGRRQRGDRHRGGARRGRLRARQRAARPSRRSRPARPASRPRCSSARSPPTAASPTPAPTAASDAAGRRGRSDDAADRRRRGNRRRRRTRTDAGVTRATRRPDAGGDADAGRRRRSRRRDTPTAPRRHRRLADPIPSTPRAGRGSGEGAAHYPALACPRFSPNLSAMKLALLVGAGASPARVPHGRSVRAQGRRVRRRSDRGLERHRQLPRSRLPEPGGGHLLRPDPERWRASRRPSRPAATGARTCIYDPGKGIT